MMNRLAPMADDVMDRALEDDLNRLKIEMAEEEAIEDHEAFYITAQ